MRETLYITQGTPFFKELGAPEVLTVPDEELDETLTPDPVPIEPDSPVRAMLSIAKYYGSSDRFSALVDTVNGVTHIALSSLETAALAAGAALYSIITAPDDPTEDPVLLHSGQVVVIPTV